MTGWCGCEPAVTFPCRIDGIPSIRAKSVLSGPRRPVSHTTAGPAAGHDAQVAEAIDEYFRSAVSALSSLPTPSGIAPPGADDPVRPGTGLTARAALELFDAQLASRHLDLAARWLRRRARASTRSARPATRATPRSPRRCAPPIPRCCTTAPAAFYLRPRPRRSAAPTRSATCCSAWSPRPPSRSPAAGTRCSAATTSRSSRRPRRSPRTCRARSGVAFAIGARRAARAWRRRGRADAVAVCSFGDASVNHSTRGRRHQHRRAHRLPGPAAAAAVRVRGQRPRHQHPHPAGLDRRRPTGPGRAWRYFAADGRDSPRCYDSARAAAEFVRVARRPAFLHLHTVRLMGHAGSDVEGGLPHRRRDRRRLCPRPAAGHRARCSSSAGLLDARRRSSTATRPSAREVLGAAPKRSTSLPQLDSAAAVDGAARATTLGATAAGTADAAAPRRRCSPAGCPTTSPLTLAQSINRALADVLADYPRGTGVRRGRRAQGRRLRRHPRAAEEIRRRRGCSTRCWTSRRSSGLALGAGVSGLLPIPEIQYLAYLHNAADQIRGEAATLQFFSQRASTATRWWCASPATDTRRGSAATSTTTTRSRRCATSPGSSSPPRRGPTTPRRCCAPARRRRGRRGGVRVPRTDRALPHPRPATTDGDGGWLASRFRCARAARRDAHLRRRHRPDHPHLRQRRADEPARRAPSRRVRDLRACRGSALAGAAPGRRHRRGGERDRARARRRRDPPQRRGVGGRRHRPRRRRVHRARCARVASADSFVPLGDAALAVLLSEDTIEAAARALVAGEE